MCIACPDCRTLQSARGQAGNSGKGQCGHPSGPFVYTFGHICRLENAARIGWPTPPWLHPRPDPSTTMNRLRAVIAYIRTALWFVPLLAIPLELVLTHL